MRAPWILLASATLSLFALRAAEPVTVRVFAYAPAPRGVERAGEAILRRAGVETRWTACTPARGDCADLRDGEILLKVVRRPWKGGPPPWSFGAAVVDAHPYLAWVFAERIEQAARANAARAATIMSHVMAHEAAHLLGLSHSEHGIMQCEFSAAEIESAATGQLRFTDREEADLRAAVARRPAAPRP